MRQDEPRATYKVPEAARVAGVGSNAIRKGIAEGKIPHIRFGRNILIPKNAFHRYLDSCGGTVAPPQALSALPEAALKI